MTNNSSTYAAHTDYDLHGIVGVRLLDASSHDVRTITRQLGPIQASLTRTPDIVIRFVDQLPFSSPLRYLGVDDAGFTDDAFLVLRSKHHARAKVQIPMEQIGQRCEIVCERGLPAVPFLIAIINLTALSKGALPMHATAFSYNGKGVLTTGWSKGGKTETLLSFMAHGAKYIGDEWVYISQDGKRMYGIPEPIRVWDWHLQRMPQYWAQVAQGERVRLHMIRLMVQALDRSVTSGLGNGGGPGKLVQRVTPHLKQQLHVQLTPHKLFGPESSQPEGNFDKVFLVGSHDSPDISVQPIDPQEIAQRMVFSLQEERQEFISCYHKFRFAFPGMRNQFIEQAEGRQREILTRVLANKEAYAVYHPYPFDISRLFDVLSPLI
jgi:hypothetical protein